MIVDKMPKYLGWRKALPRGKGWRLRYVRRYRRGVVTRRRVEDIPARLIHVWNAPDRTRFVLLRLYEGG